MKGWIWWQLYWTDDPAYVSMKQNISNEPDEDNRIFISSFDGKGPFEKAQEEKPNPIGFNIKR